ncbi:MAG: hypothetical protein JOZ39_08940 [Chloroflexi bacterium]|nr:hypothetical protein [Chloroflexota bacterium]
MQRTLPILLAVVFVLLAIFYLIPGINHPLSFSGSPTASHVKHAIVFFGLAVLSLIWARMSTGATANR